MIHPVVIRCIMSVMSRVAECRKGGSQVSGRESHVDESYFPRAMIVIHRKLYRVYQKKVDKSEIALYFVKRFNVRTCLLK